MSDASSGDTAHRSLTEELAEYADSIQEIRRACAAELAAVQPFEDVVGDVRVLRFLRGFKVRALRLRPQHAARPSLRPARSLTQHVVADAAEAYRGMLEWRVKHDIDAIHRAAVGGEFRSFQEFPYWNEIGKYFCEHFDHGEDKVGLAEAFALWIRPQLTPPHRAVPPPAVDLATRQDQNICAD